MEGTLTTKEAAERLGISTARVRQMVLAGNLPAEKFGRDLVIREADLALVADRKPGRPKKANEAETIEASRKSAPLKAKATKKRMAKKAGN